MNNADIHNRMQDLGAKVKLVTAIFISEELPTHVGAYGQSTRPNGWTMSWNAGDQRIYIEGEPLDSCSLEKLLRGCTYVDSLLEGARKRGAELAGRFDDAEVHLDKLLIKGGIDA